MMIELIEGRQENSKTYDLGNGKRRLEAHIGAIHYKDNYADKSERWKDIDLNWEGNRITKAPYELTRDGNKLTIRDKKTGEVSTIEILEVGGLPVPTQAWEHSKGLARALDTDLEIVAQNTRVRFVRILKSSDAPLGASFKVTGNFRVGARDEDGEISVESTLKDGILTETLKPDRPVKYPVRIDPTLDLSVAVSADDDVVARIGTYWSNTAQIRVGYTDSSYNRYGSGMRFTGVNIPSGANISVAYLTLIVNSTRDLTVVNSELNCENSSNPSQISSYADHIGRTRTADVAWDNIPTWSVGDSKQSPSIVSPIQTVVNDQGGTGDALIVFWEDRSGRTTETDTTFREAASEDHATYDAPKLVINYEGEPVTFIPKIVGII